MILNVGDTIVLRLQLTDGNTGKYPQAVLKDASGASVGSPVSLSHIANGLYGADGPTMPSTAEVTATYIVYSDSGHSSVDSTYERALDIYEINKGSAGGSGVEVFEEIVGTVDTSQATGTVEAVEVI